MRGRNFIILILAGSIAFAALAGSAFMNQRLDQERVRLQLTFNADVQANLPPDVALMVSMFGCFRGLMIDFLWQKANKLKEENKVYAAKDLSDLITKLQPRFKEVWVFHSWNMAYNISVMTKTQRERWMWVNNGIELLRDHGVVYNPDSVAIHKQLAWTFIHKIGRISDDMHWYYKSRLAEEWQGVLGPPPPLIKVNQHNLSGEPVLDEKGNPLQRWAIIEAFAPIAHMDQLFFSRDELNRDVRRGLGELIKRRAAEMSRLSVEPAKDPVLRDAMPMMYLRPTLFSVEAADRLRRWPKEDEAYTLEMQRLVELNEAHLALTEAGRDDPDAAFLARFPEAAPQVAALRERGHDLDYPTLMRLAEASRIIAIEAMGYSYKAASDDGTGLGFFMQWLRGGDAEAARVRGRLILPYLRAKVIRTHYHMSPSYMFELMEGEWLVQEDQPLTKTRDESTVLPLPIDWRHPAAHGLYWSSRGVWAAKSRLHRSDSYYQEVLNTYRLVCHSMQALMHNGRVSYDPLSHYYDQMPHMEFVEGYLRVFYGSGESIGGMWTESAAPESYKSGHRFFLEWAVRAYFEQGYTNKAEEFYDELGRTYGPTAPELAQEYSQPLSVFAFAENVEEQGVDNPSKARRAIYSRLVEAFRWAYGYDRPGIANIHAARAQQIYITYQAEFNKATANTYQSRLGLPHWEQVISNSLLDFMLHPSPKYPMALRQRVWYAIGNDPKNAWRRNAVWDRLRGPLYRLSELNPHPTLTTAQRFPEPPGMDEWRKSQQAEGRAEDIRKTGKAADQYDNGQRPSGQGQ